MSGGSDFHGSSKPETELGCCGVDEETFNKIFHPMNLTKLSNFFFQNCHLLIPNGALRQIAPHLTKKPFLRSMSRNQWKRLRFSKIAKALQSSGLKVGLYTSPHLFSFCERIVVSGIPISEEDVRCRLQKLFEHRQDLFFFELATLLAFEYFRDQKVDVAVIETGMGGLYDATNIIEPLVSMITSISFDHEECLGNTLEKIAEQKAGIIKPNVPVVIGPKADFAAIRNQARACNSPLYKVGLESARLLDLENAAIARQALKLLPYPLSEKDIEIGLKSSPRAGLNRSAV